MVLPALFAGMVEGDFATRNGINPVGVRVLVVVAPLGEERGQRGLFLIGHVAEQ
jgi:hypothetical protein